MDTYYASEEATVEAMLSGVAMSLVEDILTSEDDAKE